MYIHNITLHYIKLHYVTLHYIHRHVNRICFYTYMCVCIRICTCPDDSEY